MWRRKHEKEKEKIKKWLGNENQWSKEKSVKKERTNIKIEMK